MWVLGTKPRYSGRAATNHLTTKPFLQPRGSKFSNVRWKAVFAWKARTQVIWFWPPPPFIHLNKVADGGFLTSAVHRLSPWLWVSFIHAGQFNLQTLCDSTLWC